MHDTIVNNINSVVAPNDELFILGDVSFYGGDKVRDLLSKIHGRKYFIIGNHDAKNLKNWEGWVGVNHYLEIKDEGKHVVLMHYPIESWHGQNHGWIHLHGHRHGVGSRYNGKSVERGIRVDVGVDPFNFFPVTLKGILEKE
jgi:calcineurin-like phosphoesterase family protein